MENVTVTNMPHHLCISQEAFDAISSYAKVARIPVERAASEALIEWMDLSGESILEELQRIRRNKRAKNKTKGSVTHPAETNLRELRRAAAQ